MSVSAAAPSILSAEPRSRCTRPAATADPESTGIPFCSWGLQVLRGNGRFEGECCEWGASSSADEIARPNAKASTSGVLAAADGQQLYDPPDGRDELWEVEPFSWRKRAALATAETPAAPPGVLLLTRLVVGGWAAVLGAIVHRRVGTAVPPRRARENAGCVGRGQKLGQRRASGGGVEWRSGGSSRFIFWLSGQVRLTADRDSDQIQCLHACLGVLTTTGYPDGKNVPKLGNTVDARW